MIPVTAVGRVARKRWVLSLLRALALALVLPLASSGALPTWALLLGVESVHVCHCAADHNDCFCAKCNTDDGDAFASSDAITGQCGDDDIVFGGKAVEAILPPSSILAPPSVHIAFVDLAQRTPTSLDLRPPTPPPRSSSSAV